MLFIIAFFISGCTPHTTGATEVGVRTNKVGTIMEKGIQTEVYPPGSTSFFPTLLTDWHLFDTAIQNLEMTHERNTGDLASDDSLRFKTIDGNDISVNVNVAWRILPDQAPYLLRFVGGEIRAISDSLIRPVSRSVIRDVLNELASEEYYNADIRFSKAEEAKDLLNLYLNGEGIHIEQVLLGEHQFTEAYQQVIREMKIAEQEASRLKSETEAAREQINQEIEVARGEAATSIETAIGQSQQRQLEADALFFERERQAQAILTEKQALALGLTERAKAMSGTGGESLVKLEVAKALLGKKIIFLPAASGLDVRNTDVNALLQTYGIQSTAK
jgi:regulator of protease activity HflC (stomatin/prohibitin superfamily)